MIELKKEDLRDRLRDADVSFLTDEEVGEKWADAYNESVRVHILSENQKNKTLGQLHLKQIAEETNRSLSEITRIYQLRTKDTYSWVYSLVADALTADEETKCEEIRQWYKELLIDHDNLRRENIRLQEEIKRLAPYVHRDEEGKLKPST